MKGMLPNLNPRWSFNEGGQDVVHAVWMSTATLRRESPREEATVQSDSDVVGTVMVRDVVSRAVVAHFRAHTAPLLVLQWDASGTLLVTASVHGHNVNVFQVSLSFLCCAKGQMGYKCFCSSFSVWLSALHCGGSQESWLSVDPALTIMVICPVFWGTAVVTRVAMQVSPGKLGSNGERLPGRAVHLLRLLRGLTPAVIQDVAFSACGTLLTVSSARGTTHIYRLALSGEAYGAHNVMGSCSISVFVPCTYY